MRVLDIDVPRSAGALLEHRIVRTLVGDPGTILRSHTPLEVCS
jgi:hypothetical protein